VFWLRFVKTRDEADLESVKPFPRHDPARCAPEGAPEFVCFGCKLAALWRVLDQEPKVAIPKSRQTMMSWLMCAFCVWYARFHEHKAVYWQTQKDADANAMVCLPGGSASTGATARMQFIERTLPEWMRLPVKEAEGLLAYPNGSIIQALAGGKDQIRGKTPSLIVEDEFAFQPEGRGVWTSVGPTLRKACKFIAVSTPNGTDNIFAELVHGYPMELTSGV